VGDSSNFSQGAEYIKLKKITRRKRTLVNKGKEIYLTISLYQLLHIAVGVEGRCGRDINFSLWAELWQITWSVNEHLIEKIIFEGLKINVSKNGKGSNS
jgi:hypothetical protein